MRNTPTCPECGAAQIGHHQCGAGADPQSDHRDLEFARVLNGQQWRNKPLYPPRDRDDLAPND